MRLPRRLLFDMIWLISGHGQPWTNPAESDLMLRDLWNAFPPDITPEETGLPVANQAPALGVTNPLPTDGTSVHSIYSRRHQSRTDWRPRSEHVTGALEEEDIADGTSDWDFAYVKPGSERITRT